MLPSMYCCEECFRADWKTHKKKHDEFANRKSEHVEHLESFKGDPSVSEKLKSKKYRKDLKRMSQDMQMERSYTQTMALIQTAMFVMDYNKAENLCKKAIEGFPSYPEPYHDMAIILFDQNELKDSMRFLESSMEKTCHLLLTVEKKSNEPLLTHKFQRRKFIEKMSLLACNLKERNESTAEPNFLIADWIVNDKKFMSLWSYYLELIKDKSFDRVVKQLDPEAVSSLIESTRNRAEANTNQTSSPYFDGEWVIAHGLTSSVGKSLNHRVAIVKGDDLNEEGRVAVVFKEGGIIKHLKVDNLKHARTVNAKAALLMFLEESEQWRFMMDDFLTV